MFEDMTTDKMATRYPELLLTIRHLKQVNALQSFQEALTGLIRIRELPKNSFADELFAKNGT